MTPEQLAELKDAWPGDWRKSGVGYVLAIGPQHTVGAFWRLRFGVGPVIWTEIGYHPQVSSDRNARTFHEAVASFRANARKVAAVYDAIAWGPEHDLR